MLDRDSGLLGPRLGGREKSRVGRGLLPGPHRPHLGNVLQPRK